MNGSSGVIVDIPGGEHGEHRLGVQLRGKNSINGIKHANLEGYLNYVLPGVVELGYETTHSKFNEQFIELLNTGVHASELEVVEALSVLHCDTERAKIFLDSL